MKNRAFTLVELLVVIAIIGILAAMMLPAFSRARDSAKRAQCQSNLRQVAICYHLYTQDFRDRLPTRDQLGNSSYRVVVDPLGLPRFFHPYGTTNRVWLCPAGRKTLASNGVNFAWSRAQNLVGESGSSAAFNSMHTTVVVWDNFTYALPSVFGVPEGSSGGPSAVTSALRYPPHSRNKRVNYLYLDGHVETR